MILKIKTKIDTAKLKTIVGGYQKLINKNIQTVLQKEALPDLVNRILEGYDRLIERAETLPEDPTNPANWREDFRLKLLEELEQNFLTVGNRIIIRLGDKEFLGYDPSGKVDANDTTPAHWLVYYLEGLAGDWAFISPAMYERYRGAGSFKNWGRFQNGFMISREEYYAEGWDAVVPYDQVRHPFSGYSPVDIFEEALYEWRLRPYIQKAITAAVKGRKL